MRHYSLVPVRYNEQQLLVRCEPIDAELWSIQWAEWAAWISDRAIIERADGTSADRYPAMHWFADISPLEHDNADAIVRWLNHREQMATLPPELTAVESRDKP